MSDLSEVRPPGEQVFYGGGDALPLERPTNRRRDEIDQLLLMAEGLQEKLERTSQQFLTTTLTITVVVAAGGVGVVMLVSSALTTVYKTSILAAGFVCLTAAMLFFLRTQNRFEIQRRRDRNALNEVLRILHELEPVLRATKEWSRLDEAQFRIRLSRLDVGSLGKESSALSDLRIDKFAKTMRFLLEASNAHYRELLERLFQNIDVAVKNIMEAANFDEVISRAGAHLEVVSDVDFQKIVQAAQAPATATKGQFVSNRLAWAQWGGVRSVAVFDDGRIVMTRASKRDFDARQEQLRIQLG